MSLAVFAQYPKECAIIGHILTGYGGLEYQFSHCLSGALGDRPSVFRAFFRLRGEQQRIEVADALMRHHYEEVGLKDQYAEMLGAIRWCRDIRNQYAHCQWSADKVHGLYFTNMEDPAKKASGEIIFKIYYIDEALLTLQEKYCVYTDDCLYFLKHEMHKRRGEVSSHSFLMPKIIPQPPLYSPAETHPAPPKA